MDTLLITAFPVDPAIRQFGWSVAPPDGNGGVQPLDLMDQWLIYTDYLSLANYLLTRPDTDIDTIVVLSANEIDHGLLVSHQPTYPDVDDRVCLSPDPQAIENAKLYWNTVQDAIDDAKSQHVNTSAHNGVKLYHGCEVAYVKKAFELGSSNPTAASDVIPHTDCDLYGYSAYETTLPLYTTHTYNGFDWSCDGTIANPTFGEAIQYLKNQVSLGSYSGDYVGERVFISEYGLNQSEWPLLNDPPLVDSLGNAAIQTAIYDENLPIFNYWALYGTNCPPPQETYQQVHSACAGFGAVREVHSVTDVYNLVLSQQREDVAPAQQPPGC